MAKFSNPLGGSNKVYITQTYHGAYNRAIDLYGETYRPNLSCYAIADGKISYTSTGAGSYCVLDVAGTDFRVWYVHTHNWLRTGTVVKKGQKICEIAPKSKNGGYPEHLHLGLTPTSKNIMDYFDRIIPFRTNYSDIKKIWFKSDGTLDWSKHKDLSYTNDPVLTLGTKWRFVDTMNIRDKADGKIIKEAGKGSVCEIISKVARGQDFDWYKCKWADFEGWVANTTRNAISQLQVTNVDGTKPPDKPDLQDEVDRLSVEVNRLKETVQEREETIKEGEGQMLVLLEQLETYKVNLEETKKELKGMDDKYTTLMIQKKTLANTNADLVEELRVLKEGRDSIIKKIGDILHKLFSGGE